MAWTDIFGGQTVNPQDLSYKSYSLAANKTLLWDDTTAESDSVVADIMDIAATVAGVTVTMPDARQAGSGAAVLIFNAGAESFNVVSATGVAIVTLASGKAWYVWLRDNTTQSGLWRAIEFGAGSSSASAASLASPTVKASGTSLVQAMPVRDVNSDYTVGDGDRGRLIRWTGGVGTVTLPLAASVGGDWFAALRNDGTGALTVARSGSDLIDAASSLTLNPTESAMLVTDGAGYFTITKTIALTNSFTLISIAVPGSGNYTLSAAEIGFSSYVFTGILTGNRTIIVPATVAPYRVRNNTTGSFTLTVKTAAGTGVVVDQNNGKFLTSDGTNVFDQVTPGIATPIAIADGGTGATTASAARTNLGATSLGGDLFTTANAAAARTSLGLGSIATQDASSVAITGGAISGITDLALADGGTGASTAAAARTNLGLGSIATQAADNVAIAGGSVTGITDLAVADGGTGASTAADARTNLGIIGYRLRKVTTFTSSGTWTPESYTRLAVIRAVGGGGGGGGASASVGSGVAAAGGGGAGGYVERFLTAGWGATETVTIGAAGADGASAAGTGGTGGNTTVGTLVTANGGVGGQGATQTNADARGAPGGAGGAASVSGGTSLLDLQIAGENGLGGISLGSGNTGFSGAGASSRLGRGAAQRTEGSTGVAGSDYGSGGSGACSDLSAARAGGAGGPGIAIIEEWE